MRSTVWTCLVLFALGAVPAYAGEENPSVEIKPNTWVKAAIDWKAALPTDIPDARWVTTDGYSDNLYRSKTGTVRTIKTHHDFTRKSGFPPMDV